MAHRKWLLWSVLALGAGILLLRYTVWAPESIPVRVARAELGRVESTISNTKAGTVKARRRAQISPETGGRVVEIAHREGERVQAGAPLLRLNDATHRAELLLANESLRAVQASRGEACVARDRAHRDLERKRTLARENIVSEDLLDQLETVAKAADASCKAVTAEVGTARARIAVVEAELEKLTLRAPFDGVIAEVAVEVGEWITPSPPLLPTPAVIETQNRTVEIEVELEDQEFSSQLLPGTSADVEVILEAREDVLRIPTSALLEGRHVLLARDGTLVDQPVEVGLKNWDYAEVRSGISAGQLVVVSLDRAEVKAGAVVEVTEIDGRP